ncbi:hypothetical protein HDV01_005710 [Terramyces sp. JEL0728]|nr:hypothetical protein HDV01_005710 [Terramyces sp. JEL0728]
MEQTENIDNTFENISNPIPSYSLDLRQSPIQAVVCPQAGNDRDKKLLEPAAIVEITQHESYNNESVCQPFIFATAILVDAETQKEILLLDDKETPILNGSTSSSVHHLLDPEKELKGGMFLVFPDIAVRKEGCYKLKIVLYKIEAGTFNPLKEKNKVTRQAEVITESFQIIGEASNGQKKKKIPPPILSRSFSQQGIKMKLKRQPSPPPKRRATEIEPIIDEPEKKHLRSTRVRSKSIENTSEDSQTSKKETLPSASGNKVGKSRISDLLNVMEPLIDKSKEISYLPSRNSRDHKLPRLKHCPSVHRDMRREEYSEHHYSRDTEDYVPLYRPKLPSPTSTSQPNYRSLPPPSYGKPANVHSYYPDSPSSTRLPPIRSMPSYPPYPPYEPWYNYNKEYPPPPSWDRWRPFENGRPDYPEEYYPSNYSHS